MSCEEHFITFFSSYNTALFVGKARQGSESFNYFFWFVHIFANLVSHIARLRKVEMTGGNKHTLVHGRKKKEFETLKLVQSRFAELCFSYTTIKFLCSSVYFYKSQFVLIYGDGVLA